MFTINCTADQFNTIKGSLEYFAELPWWDIEPDQLAEIKAALKAVRAAKWNEQQQTAAASI